MALNRQRRRVDRWKGRGVFLLLSCFAWPCLSLAGDPASTKPRSKWVHEGPDGELSYAKLERGDRIMDFSSAGYMGGGIGIPAVPVRATVSPSGGDDTVAIQSAIDAVAKLEPKAGFFRGAVLLQPGTYTCKGSLRVSSSGVVLRGSGSGPNGSTIKMEGAPHVCIVVSGVTSIKEIGPRIRILDAYIPSGATSFKIENGSDLKSGDTIRIRRPVTSSWVKFMSMDALVRDGRKETWLSNSGDIFTSRKITGLDGARISLDVPITDSFDSKQLDPPGASVVKCVTSGQIVQCGVESLRIVSPPQAVEIAQRHHQAILINGAVDCWLRDVAIEDTVNSVSLGAATSRITVENVRLRHTLATLGAAKPADLSASGSQILFNRCTGNGDNIFYFVTGPRATGPIVLLNCSFRGSGHIQPHARWATGLLVDCCEVPESGIDFMNRGEMGSGHGWTIGWAVAWNCVARSYVIQQPPGAANWAIGCRGAREVKGMPFNHEPPMAEGIFDSHDSPVTPTSLYLAQLKDRAGAQALKNIGY